MNIKKIAALLLVLILAVSGAAADGFFSGSSVQTGQKSFGSFFGGKAAASDTSLSRGYGYTDMTGKQPDRIQEYPDYCEIQYTYDQVSEDACRAYMDFVAGKGFYGDLAEYTNDYCVYEVYNDNFEFAIAYNWTQQILTVIFYTDLDQDITGDDTWNIDAWNGNTGSDDIFNDDTDPHGDDGHDKCNICGGRGYQVCDACSGTGICGSCCGMPTQYVTGWGADKGTYVTCSGCHGSARCIYCGGTGYQACTFCD